MAQTLDFSASVGVLEDLAHQDPHVERLADMAVHAGLEAGAHIIGKDIGCHCNDRRALVGANALKGAGCSGWPQGRSFRAS